MDFPLAGSSKRYAINLSGSDDADSERTSHGEEIADLIEDDYDDRSDTADDEGSLSELELEAQQEFASGDKFETLSSAISLTGVQLTLGVKVELDDGDFFRVKQLLRRRRDGNDFMKGDLLRRIRRLHRKCSRQRNELSLMDIAGGVIRPVSSAIKEREIVFTNRMFPQLSFRESLSYRCRTNAERLAKELYDEENATLVCRWKTESYDQTMGKMSHPRIERLSENECDRGKGISDAQLMLSWRLGFAATMRAKKRARTSINAQQYMFGDICAGGGGATRAADRAGLEVKFALDKEKDACATLSLNWPKARVLEMTLNHFLTSFETRTWMNVDVLHISFPCQPNSLLQRTPGKFNDANEATSCSILQILEKIRPRIVTLEQTDGIVKKHARRQWYETMIRDITTMGYNVHPKIIDFADTGNVHARNRLWIYASCPGQPLPRFPNPTHGTGPGLKRQTTIGDNLRKVPAYIEPHMRKFTPKNERPYHDNVPLKDLISTNGGKGDLHPSGERSFNVQELAMMQHFPAKHRFFGTMTSIRTQIGNAVPAIAATPYFEAAVESLRAFDEEVATYLATQEEPIILD